MEQARKWLGLLPIALLVTAAAIYGIGLHLITTQLCKQVGPNTAAIGVAFVLFSAGVMVGRAIVVRSIGSWVACVVVLALALVMSFLIGVMAVAGCGGV